MRRPGQRARIQRDGRARNVAYATAPGVDFVSSGSTRHRPRSSHTAWASSGSTPLARTRRSGDRPRAEAAHSRSRSSAHRGQIRGVDDDRPCLSASAAAFNHWTLTSSDRCAAPASGAHGAARGANAITKSSPRAARILASVRARQRHAQRGLSEARGRGVLAARGRSRRAPT